MRILGVSGSLREGSFNKSLLRAAAEAAPEGVELELWEGLAELPLYDENLDGDDAPEPVRRLREAWDAADAILFATPEYNGSVPGGLKNAIDWASRPRLDAVLRNKTVAVAGASTGQFGALWAQQDLKRSSVSPAPASSARRSRSAARPSASTPRDGFSTASCSSSCGFI